MDNETYKALARARIERAKELLDEAEELLVKEKYKSAKEKKPGVNKVAFGDKMLIEGIV